MNQRFNSKDLMHVCQRKFWNPKMFYSKDPAMYLTTVIEGTTSPRPTPFPIGLIQGPHIDHVHVIPMKAKPNVLGEREEGGETWWCCVVASTGPRGRRERWANAGRGDWVGPPLGAHWKRTCASLTGRCRRRGKWRRRLIIEEDEQVVSIFFFFKFVLYICVFGWWKEVWAGWNEGHYYWSTRERDILKSV